LHARAIATSRARTHGAAANGGAVVEHVAVERSVGRTVDDADRGDVDAARAADEELRGPEAEPVPREKLLVSDSNLEGARRIRHPRRSMLLAEGAAALAEGTCPAVCAVSNVTLRFPQ